MELEDEEKTAVFTPELKRMTLSR